MRPIKCGGIREVSQEEWDAMIAGIDAEKAARAAKMPTETDALKQMHEAWTRLKELGFGDARHAPKNETVQVIEIGSTGIHEGYRDETSDSCLFWLHDDGDLWPSRPILWRKLPTPEVSDVIPADGEK